MRDKQQNIKYYVYWKKSNENRLIGFLSFKDKKWKFYYDETIKSSIKNGFQPFIELNKVDEVYYSKKPFLSFLYRLDNENNSINLLTDNILIKERTSENNVIEKN